MANSTMKKIALLISFLAVALLWHGEMVPATLQKMAMAQGTAPSRAVGDEAAVLEKQRQQLMEKEEALKAKEEQLKKLSASLESRIKELNAARQAMEGALQTRKKQENDRFKKILKVYKGLRPEEAGKLMDKLDETLAIEMLNQMDLKTAVKLIPYLNQPRVLKWTRENLVGRP